MVLTFLTLESHNSVLFYYLCASEICPDI